jgi:hypothetical protein
MGQIMDGAYRIGEILRQGRLDEQNAAYRASQEAKLDEQARAAKAKQDELDRVAALGKQADAAGANVLNGYRAQSILDGGNENDYKPTIGHLSEAYGARGAAYLNAGDMKGYLQNHAEGAALRAQMRSTSVQEAMSTGDPMSVMKALNASVDNGIHLQDIKPISMPSQDPESTPGQAYKATYKLPDGSTRDEMLTANDIQKRAAYVLANPDKIGEQELKYDYLRQQTEAKLKEQDNKGANDRASTKVEQQERRITDGLENAGRIKLAGVKGAEDRKTDAAKEGLTRTRPVTLSPGQEIQVPEAQPDGRLKYTPVARNKTTKTAPGLSSKDLNTVVINNFGVLDPGTGKQVGSETTAKLSAAAEQLMAANPGLGANEAIVAAADDMGLSIKAKSK